MTALPEKGQSYHLQADAIFSSSMIILLFCLPGFQTISVSFTIDFIFPFIANNWFLNTFYFFKILSLSIKID